MWLHFRFPKSFLDTPENRAFFEKADQEENITSKVTLDEKLRQSSIWGVELYGPKEVSALYENLERIGLTGSPFLLPEKDVIEWLWKARRYGHVGQRNLGVVHSRNIKRVGQDYYAPVPEFCEYLIVSINQITPSLTAVHVCFVLTEGASKRYESILNTDRKTTYRSLQGRKGYSISGVLHQKREAIQNARLERARIASDWFARHLPGLFSSGALVDELPTGELITLRNHTAFIPPGEDSDPDLRWSNLLGIDRWHEGWRHPKHEGFGLILDEQSNIKRYHSIAILKTSAIPDDHYMFNGRRDKSAYDTIAYHALGGIAIHLATLSYLREIGRRIREAREGIGQASKDRRSLIKTLDQLEAFYRNAIGDPAIAAELAAIQKNQFDFYCENFSSKNIRGDKVFELPDVLHRQTIQLAENVRADGVSARQLFQELASTLSARESIRAQKRMELLSILAVVIAGISLFIGVKRENTIHVKDGSVNTVIESSSDPLIPTR